jgi:hypothetical protein
VKYAANTSVPVERSRSEIESTLRRYGCTAFAFGWAKEGAMIQFTHRGRAIKLDITAPPGLRPGTMSFEREERRRWRVLLLWVKAQLEAIEAKLVTFEEVFLPWTLLQDGSTVAQSVELRKLLPAASGREA